MSYGISPSLVLALVVELVVGLFWPNVGKALRITVPKT
jgi:hypothetical protein